jgi:hypothetical protein
MITFYHLITLLLPQPLSLPPPSSLAPLPSPPPPLPPPPLQLLANTARIFSNIYIRTLSFG